MNDDPFRNRIGAMLTGPGGRHGRDLLGGDHDAVADRVGSRREAAPAGDAAAFGSVWKGLEVRKFESRPARPRSRPEGLRYEWRAYVARVQKTRARRKRDKDASSSLLLL